MSEKVIINRYQENGSVEKLRGAVYTPPRIATTLVKWAIRAANDRVLDPACGDGVFLTAATKRLIELGHSQPQPAGVDIDPQAAADTNAVCDDFFAWAEDAPKFEAIVGNPPFIRSHLFPETSRQLAFKQMKAIGLRPSRLMSTWAPFVAVASKLLSEQGRLAFVVPEELLHVKYAAQLREFLLERFRRVIVCLPDENLFPSVQQAVVLLLCDNERTGQTGLFAATYSELTEGETFRPTPAPAWDWTPKWTHLFLTTPERECISSGLQELAWEPFSAYGRVQVGVVTGYNRFFIVSQQKAAELGSDYFTPIVTKTQDLRGLELSPEIFDDLADKGRPAYLLDTSNPIETLPDALRNYLDTGRQRGINERYKCRNRDPWYGVPSIWPADALLFRQAGEIPKLVHLSTQITATDTIHRVHWHDPALGKQHVAGFLNTWTLLFCELTGRSYGGGVLELMPGEANRLPIPPPTPSLSDIFGKLDQLARQRKHFEVIDLVDNIVLPLSISTNMRKDARDILLKLIARRKNKGNGNHRG